MFWKCLPIVLIVAISTHAQRGSRKWYRERTNDQTSNSTREFLPISSGYNTNDTPPYDDHLEKINDRLTAISTLDQQKIRKLESIDYKLTRIEVQLQEKVELLKTELREASRRVQQLDWQSAKIDTKIEQVKDDLAYLRHAYVHVAGGDKTQMCTETNDSRTAFIVNNVKQVASAVDGIQTTLRHVQTSMLDVKRNISALNNSTRDVAYTVRKDLVTKQFLNGVIADWKQCNVHISSDHPSSRNVSNVVTDCRKISGTVSGIYKIRPAGSDVPFFVYCDMTSDNGGWTVIQNRFEGTIDFERGWYDYKHGFGNLNGEFWLGLDKIHLLTNTEQLYELRIDMEDFAHERKYAKYDMFSIGPESRGYPLMFLGNYTGDAGDSLIYHAGQKFTTNDMDNDNWPDGNCAESHTGAWWYNGCDNSNLNGKYLHGEVPPELEYQGIYWYEWRGPIYSLMRSRMMIRPRSTGNEKQN